MGAPGTWSGAVWLTLYLSYLSHCIILTDFEWRSRFVEVPENVGENNKITTTKKKQNKPLFGVIKNVHLS